MKDAQLGAITVTPSGFLGIVSEPTPIPTRFPEADIVNANLLYK